MIERAKTKLIFTDLSRLSAVTSIRFQLSGLVSTLAAFFQPRSRRDESAVPRYLATWLGDGPRRAARVCAFGSVSAETLNGLIRKAAPREHSSCLGPHYTLRSAAPLWLGTGLWLQVGHL